MRLGGYPNKNKFFLKKRISFPHENILLNGRSSFYLILDFFKPDLIHVPFYICRDIVNVLKEKKVKFKFYGLKRNLKPKKIIFKKKEYFLAVPYFGIIKLKKNKRSIFDLSTSFFYPKKNLIFFNSLRKFFYVNFGSFLNINNKFKLKNAISSELKNIELPKNYNDFLNNEKNHYVLNKNVKKFVSINFFKLNFNLIKKKRNENFVIYHKTFEKINQIKINIKEVVGPQYYPLLINDGFKIRKKLIKKKIFIPNLWSELNVKRSKMFKFEIKLSKNCLYLPVNENLQPKEIKYIIKEVLICYKRPKKNHEL